MCTGFNHPGPQCSFYIIGMTVFNSGRAILLIYESFIFFSLIKRWERGEDKLVDLGPKGLK